MRTINDLSSEELTELICDYKKPKEITIKQIIAKYSLEINQYKLVDVLPEYLTDTTCRFCQKPMYAKIVNRNDEILHCQSCQHMIYPDSINYWNKKCNCNNCESEKTKIYLDKVDQIYDYYYFDKPSKNLDELSSKQIAQVLFFISMFYDFDNSELIFGLKFDLYEEYIMSLKKDRIIYISPYNPIEAFAPDQFPRYIYPRRIVFLVNIDEINNADTIEEILDYIKNNFSEDKKNTILLELIHMDLMKQFSDKMNERGFDFEINPKKEAIFKELYSFLSYAQLDCLIYYTAKDILDQYKLKMLHRNTIPSYALKCAVKKYNTYVTKGWTISDSKIKTITTILTSFIRQVMNKDIDILKTIIK